MQSVYVYEPHNVQNVCVWSSQWQSVCIQSASNMIDLNEMHVSILLHGRDIYQVNANNSIFVRNIENLRLRLGSWSKVKLKGQRASFSL